MESSCGGDGRCNGFGGILGRAFAVAEDLLVVEGAGICLLRSLVDGLGGNACRRCRHESKDSTAKFKKLASLLLTQSVHRNSAKRVR